MVIIKMSRMLASVVLVIISMVAVGCGKDATKTQQTDVLDPDFVATISPTNTPMLFNIEIRKVNPKVDKSIGSFPVIVDFSLTDSSGKVYEADLSEQGKYAKEVGNVFDAIRQSETTYLKGRVQLVKQNSTPGVYKVAPRMRIIEIGKDAKRGPYPDGGTVAIKAGNSIKVTIK